MLPHLMNLLFMIHKIQNQIQHMNFKQQYICEQGPYPFDFHAQRQSCYRRVQEILNSCHPDEWRIRAIPVPAILEEFKQVYGLTASQLAYFVNLFLRLVQIKNLASDTAIFLLKILNQLSHYKIEIKGLVEVENRLFLNLLEQMNEQGSPFPLKNQDPYMEQLVKVIRLYASYGEECLKSMIELAVEKRQIRYIALFVSSVKHEDSAREILSKIFAESSIWDRDTCFYYIISEITKKFDKIDYQQYYQTLFQEIIKVVTAIINPIYESDLKKIISSEPAIGVPSILKSVANILVNLLVPVGQSGWEMVWSCVERIFSLISSTLDHFKETEYMNDFLIFLKRFVSSFQQRYRRERKIFLMANEDSLEECSGNPNEVLVIGSKYLELFDSLWVQMIPQLLFLEDSDIRVSKILIDLAMFSPDKYLTVVLREILAFLEKDLTMVPLNTCKMTIALLQQFILQNYCGKQEMSLLLECHDSFLAAIEKLGVSQNLDILELVMLCFIHLPESQIDNLSVQSLMEDIITLILNNLSSMSVGLENEENEEAEAYIDLRNIYMPFLLRLSSRQIDDLSDRILYKIKENVSEHRQAYEYLVLGLCYVNKQLPRKILEHIYRQLIAEAVSRNGKHQPNDENSPQHFIPYHLDKSLQIENEEHLRWYTSLLHCSFQYNPENVIREWEKLEVIICVLLREWDKANVFDWGLDILFNILINLQNVHVDPREFQRDDNRDYRTLNNIAWVRPSQQCIQIILNIKRKFYDHLITRMNQRYGQVLQQLEAQAQTESASPNHCSPQSPSIKPGLSKAIDSLMCLDAVPTLENLAEKKIILKIISIQYSIFSAVQQVAPYTPNGEIKELESFFIKEFSGMRKEAIGYIRQIEKLLTHFNCLADPVTSKAWLYFWREAHDELFFISGVSSTNERLLPFYYPFSFRKKKLFRNSFLILNEIYVSFLTRADLHCLIRPVAYLNDPHYLRDVVKINLYGMQNETSFKSFFPVHIDVHESYHRELTNLCRIKISLDSPDSYIQKYISAQDSALKERYLQAIRNIICLVKKNQGLVFFSCCNRDSCFWSLIIELLDMYPYLEKKGDKSILIEIIYLFIIFCFDSKGTLFLDPREEEHSKQARRTINHVMSRLLAKVEGGLGKRVYKNYVLYAALSLCFSEFIELNCQEMLALLRYSCQMITGEGNPDQINIAKTIFFRVVNRVLKGKVNTTKIANTPIKRPFAEFLIYRHLGGEVMPGTSLPHQQIVSDKLQNYFYPLKQLTKIEISKLDESQPIDKLLMSYLADASFLQSALRSLMSDNDLKIEERNTDFIISQDEPKKVYHNGYKILNYILDSDPRKLDIFCSFVENFSSYPVLFYHRLFRKMILLGGQETASILAALATRQLEKCEKQEIRLKQFLMAELLPSMLNCQWFIDYYANWLLSCSNEEFQYANGCLSVVFCVNWRNNLKLFPLVTAGFKKAKGRIRLRFLEVLNAFVMSTGRFSRRDAIEGISELLQGVEEGADEVSELIVSMLISSFLIPINMELLPEWVQESLPQLLQEKGLERISNDITAFQIDGSVKRILNQIIAKTKQQKNIEAKNLKIYSKISNKILSSITVYRFNDSFYELLRETMLYLLNKPSEDDGHDDDIVHQLKDSEYPQHIYDDLICRIINMSEDKPNVIKKKLKFLGGIVINRSFCSNSVHIPDIFAANEKGIMIDHILAVSDIARIMKPVELTERVNWQLKLQKKNLNMMMSLLLAAGNRSFEWREELLKQILESKKLKIVKQFISVWWKGRSPETEEQKRLYILVRGVENPYSYFA